MIVENPVRIVFDEGRSDEIPRLLHGRSAFVVTTAGSVRRGVVDQLFEGEAGLPRVFTAVQPNPTIGSIVDAATAVLLEKRPEVLVAIGGGSVIDTAKCIAALASTGGDNVTWLDDHLRNGLPFPEQFAPLPVIAVPTTAGTGSEVTMWATVWDETSGTKYSLSHSALYAEVALLIPQLTQTMSADLTLITGLDALSHCLESMWNRKANTLSDAFASAAIPKILHSLPHVIEAPDDLTERREMQHAALLGGLAISSTTTSLAHSMSYPFTSLLGMPHGLACSFTLPSLMRFNADSSPERMQVIADAMGARNVFAAADFLDERFSEWGVRDRARQFFNGHRVADMQGALLTPSRAGNNLKAATAADAVGIVERALN
jgi:alcohol dehydrogenase